MYVYSVRTLRNSGEKYEKIECFVNHKIWIYNRSSHQSSMVLYRKFRPNKFAEIKGQSVITDILRSSIINNKVSHAYLFSGTRGTGKTTTARVFAKAVNCLSPKEGEPCNKCSICKSFDNGSNVDLIEIDAASNRGIDDIRELKEKVNFAPTMSKYKVYIIDEVHMLTKDAFNALLKTLEEPPKSVVFILATTEVYKLPLTVISRCQRFDFKNANLAELKKLFKNISSREEIVIDNESIDLVAELAEGSFRDGLSILEKLHSLEGEVTYEKSLEILGIPDEKVIKEIILSIKSGDLEKALEIFQNAQNSGMEIHQFVKNMLKFMERKLLFIVSGNTDKETNLNTNDILFFIKEFLVAEEHLKYSNVPSIAVEISILTLLDRYKGNKKEAIKEVVKEQKEEVKDEKEEIKKEKKVNNVNNVKVNITIDEILNIWPEIIVKIMPFNHHLSSFLSKSKPAAIDDNFLILEVKYPFHKDRIEETKSRNVISKVFEDMLGAKLIAKCVVNSKLSIPEESEKTDTEFEKKPQIKDNVNNEDEMLQEAMKIFEIE